MSVNQSFTRQYYECNHAHSVKRSFSVHTVTFMWLPAQCCSLITPSAGKMDDTVNERGMQQRDPRSAS